MLRNMRIFGSNRANDHIRTPLHLFQKRICVSYINRIVCVHEKSILTTCFAHTMIDRISFAHIFKNMGKGYSVNHGMRKASGKYRLFMDADNSVDITHADAFLEEMKRGSDVVIGSIRAKNSHISEHSGWYRRGFGYISKLAISIFAIPDISDTQRGFKIFSGKVADFIFPL